MINTFITIKNLFYISIAVLLFMSCSEDNNEQTNAFKCIDEVCIDGAWEWVESYGSIAGLTITPESEMQTRKLIISDTNYEEYVNDALVLETAYEYVKSDELEAFTNDSLILKLATGNWYAVFEENEQLILREPCVDCWEHVFERD